MKVQEWWTSPRPQLGCSGRDRTVEELASWLAAECSACCLSAPAGADRAFAAAVSVADHWEVGPSVDQEDQWVAVEAEKVLVGSRDPAEVRSPCSCHYHSLVAAVEVRIPYHNQAPRRAAQESHARRRAPEIVDVAGTDSAAGLGSQTAAVAAVHKGAEVRGTGSEVAAAVGVEGEMARWAQVAANAISECSCICVFEQYVVSCPKYQKEGNKESFHMVFAPSVVFDLHPKYFIR
jgi:hypothetical protein